MPDIMTIVADTLRTMMGATAADPYVRAIERAVAAATAPKHELLGEFATGDEQRAFEIPEAGVFGTVPSNRDGITAIRVYRVNDDD